MSSILVSAVIPCLNEEETLALCVRKAQDAFIKLGIVGEVVVADNGSTDNSVAIAESLGARVVSQTEKGYGAALKAGIEGARGEIVVMGDADDSYDWGCIGDFVGKVQEGNDLVMGNRFAGGIEPGAMPIHHRYLGNPVLSFIARGVSRAPIGDFHCGMRAFTREGYGRMKLQTSGMEFASEMVISAARNGLKIAEIPTKLYPDKRNRPLHLRSWSDGWRHLKFILSYAPDHLLLAPALLMLLPGLLLMALLASGICAADFSTSGTPFFSTKRPTNKTTGALSSRPFSRRNCVFSASSTSENIWESTPLTMVCARNFMRRAKKRVTTSE